MLHGTQVFHGERGGQLVEHGVVDGIPLSFVLCLDILVAQCLAEGLDLLVQTVVRHHHGKVQTGLRLAILARQQVEDDAAAETDHCRTLAVDVLHVVYVLGGFHALVLYPCCDDVTQTGHIDESTACAQSRDGLLDAGLVVGRTLAELGHLGEAGVGHLGNEDTAGESVLDVVLTEALAHGTIGAQHRPVVGYPHHARLGGV